MALSGMTGFARVDGAAGGWTWTLEARSVNGRSLEVRFRGPGGFDGLERAARDVAQGLFQRGQLNLTLQARHLAEGGGVRINVEQLERYLELCRPYVEAGRAALPAMDGLLGLHGVIESNGEANDPEALAATEAAMAAAITAALDLLKVARLEEGAALTPVLAGLLVIIEAKVAAAEVEARAQPAILKERFARRIGELVERGGDLNERIVQEAAVMASRADVREELDRLGAHVQAAKALLAVEGAVGRRLDFLTQEFMRETNTLCAKSATTALTAIGLELKAAVDQLREQVQNVE
ncbi:MAG TPA: YicC/YloC family endoribonuclease [Caulobacteraceae bacterium]|jgi:uncharacterized protein (TIGR00255 family)|nr:YicC/YloC family endoribonuclease [Caulobacteraceae bacterium]